ncbi:MAG: serine hydrolase domain-containing protein, partial [Flavobacteriaceae bacterium]
YFYNSFDWVLISLAIQEASGMPFEDYVHEKVLAPLGMTATFAENGLFTTPGQHGSLNAHMAKFYSKNHLGFRQAIAVNNYFKLAGGGFISTSADVAKFGQALLEGKLFPNEMQNEFLAPQTLNSQSTFYGLGWQVSQDRQGRPFYGHVGNGVGGYSNFFVYPNERMVFAILVNCTDPKVQEELDAVIDALILASTKPFS